LPFSSSSFPPLSQSDDAAYINNHTQGLRDHLRRALEEISIPHIRGINASFAALIPDVSVMIYIYIYI
jgi:hypothetical protein